MDETKTPTGLQRRHLVAGAGLGLGAAVLAGCGDEGGTDGDAANRPDPTPDRPSAPATGTDEQGSGAGEQPPAGSIAAVDDVPVGGGVLLREEELVLTRPSADRVLAFDAHCTHQGCLVTGVTSTIDCSCHGSKFDLADGSPVAGPATTPLAGRQVEVVDGAVVLR